MTEKLKPRAKVKRNDKLVQRHNASYWRVEQYDKIPRTLVDVKPGEQIIALSDEDPNGILRWAQVVYTGEVISNVHAREFISLADYLEILRKREEENNS